MAGLFHIKIGKLFFSLNDMGKTPSIPHQIIVDYILAGNTTADAKRHFNFASDNIANLRVWAAFKALKIERPRFQEQRMCEFCGSTYVASRRNLRSCGAKSCQESLIRQWQTDNAAKVAEANRKFKRSAKGRVANIATHKKKRLLGSSGTNVQRWRFGLDEITKSLRKLDDLSSRNLWEYRITHIQKLSKLERRYDTRRRTIKLARGIEKSKSHKAAHFWLISLRAIQAQESQYRNRLSNNIWENSIGRLQASIRIGEEVRLWKKGV